MNQEKIKQCCYICCLFLFLLVCFVGCSKKQVEKDQWFNIKQKKQVTIGLDDSFVPMGFQNKAGKIVGYDIDLATAVFQLYGIKVNFQPIDWSMKENELQNQTIDLIWNGYTKNAELEKKVAFSDSYMNNSQVIVTLKQKKIQYTSQLKNRVLGIQNCSSGYMSFENHPTSLKNYIKNQTPILYDGFNEAFLDLESSQIDGLLIDKIYANYYLAHLKKKTNFYVFPANFESEAFTVGIRKNDFLLKEKINSGFKQLRKNGKMEIIYKKWFATTHHDKK